MSDFKLTDNSDAFRMKIGEAQVSFSDLYDGFIRENTPYSSLIELLKAGGFKAESKEDIEAIPDDAVSAFVAANTKFSSWKELQEAALQNYLMNQIG